jgi:hypothetical protein
MSRAAIGTSLFPRELRGRASYNSPRAVKVHQSPNTDGSKPETHDAYYPLYRRSCARFALLVRRPFRLSPHLRPFLEHFLATGREHGLEGLDPVIGRLEK